MGNQQASFYYGLNYEESNDSGYFDDEEIAAQSAALQAAAAAAAAAETAELEVSGGKKQIVKSKSIEIGTGAGIRRRKGRTITDELNDIDEDQVCEASVFDTCACNQCTDDRMAVYSSSWSPTRSNTSNSRAIKNKSSIEKEEELEEEEEEKEASSNEQVRKRESEKTKRGEEGEEEVLVVKSASLSSSFSSYSRSLIKGMNFVGRVTRGVKDFYYEINPATLTGAIDVVVVQQEDGSFKCSPFHVRFGKLALIKTKDLTVDIEINGQPVDLHMKLGEAGEAYFIEELSLSDNDSSSCESLVNSPNSGSGSTTTLKSSSSKPSTTTAQNSDIKTNGSENLLTRTQSEINLKKSSITIIPISESMEKHLSNQIKLPSDKNPKVMNFFSDGEITPELTSPVVSRPPTPKSDTEVETKTKRDSIHVQSDPSSQWSWSWGKLPERQNSLISSTTVTNEIDKNSSSIKNKESSSSSSRLLGGMFNLMGNNNEAKTTASANKTEEIYLDDTEKLDSEVAALYINPKSNRSVKPPQINLPQSSKDDDQESGNGQSLPQSPRDSYSILGDIQISLCGLIPVNQPGPPPPPAPPTSASSSGTNLSLGGVASTPQLIPTPTQINSLYSSSPNESASPLSTSPPSSLLIISPQSPAAYNTIDSENFQVNFEDLFQQYAVSFEKFVENIATIAHDPNLVIKINNRYMNWASAAPFILSALVYQKPLPNEIANNILESNMPRVASAVTTASKQQTTTTAQQSKTGWGKNLFFSWSSKKPQSQSGEEMTKKAQIETQAKPIEQSKLNSTTSELALSMDEDLLNADSTATMKYDEQNAFIDEKPLKNEMGSSETNEGLIMNEAKVVSLNNRTYKKTTRLSSDLIKKLNLNLGANEIIYSVTTALQGTTRITSYIFLWNYDDKVIVSDIDGTITKSDVWGQVLPIFGRDWTQAGVADLYSAIEKNQYKFMYLSARAIGQSQITRDLLKNINQGGFTLPKGPLLVTPTSLFKAFQKEVIEKKPEEFKISCLKDIQLLFPAQHNPFFAGYGNKTSDVTAYKTVGIPVSRIFTINPQGELKHEVSRTFQSSYSKLCDFVDLIFPPLRPSAAIIKADYDSFNYWRYNSVPETILDEIEQEIKKVAPVVSSKVSKDKSKRQKPK